MRRQLYQIKKDSYKHLREKQKRTFFKKIRFKIQFFKLSKKFIIFLLSALLIIISIYLILFSKSLTVNQIVFDPAESGLKINADKYLGENILRFSVYSVEDYLKNTYADIDKVYVRKILPNKLEVEYSLFKLKFVYMDLEGYSIISEDFRLVKGEDFEVPLVLTDFEKRILKGLVTPEDPEVRDFYKNKLSEEEKKEFKWETVSEDIKIDELNQIKFNLDVTLKEFLKQRIDKIESYSLNLPIIVFFSDNNFNENKFADPDIINFLFAVYKDLTNLDLKIKNIQFTSKERFEVHLKNEKVLIFNFYRDWAEQLVDLKSVIYNGKLDVRNFFDFRTKNFSVSN